MLQAIEQTTPESAASLPQDGTFYSAQHAPGTAEEWPPVPGNVLGLDAWALGDQVYLLNDTNLDYNAIGAVAGKGSGHSVVCFLLYKFTKIRGNGGDAAAIAN